MKEITQTFIVTENDEFVPELSTLPPTGVEALVDHVRGSINAFTGNVALQARMALFDARHGTNYRGIRNTLVEQKKRQDFEKSIGLVAIGRK